VDAIVEEVVEDYRQMLVLADKSEALLDEQKESESTPDERDAVVIARVLYHGNRDRLDRVAEAIGGDGSAADRFAGAIMSDKLRDADRLAFFDIAMELPATAPVRSMQERLSRIQQEYAANLQAILDRLTPGARALQPVPEPWADYTAFLRERYDRKQLLAKHAQYREEAPGARGARYPWRDDERQIVGRRLPKKTVVLTFDDGPHRRFTDSVLEILDRYRIKAVFFQVGQNVRRLPQKTARIVQAGHAVGNHSLTHAYLPRLDGQGLVSEMAGTSDAIKLATNISPGLFRAPYGAGTAEIVQESNDLGMKAVLWNVDSLDWKDPLPESIAERVVQQVNRHGRGIILFHDIHRRTLVALPLVINRLRAAGYTFLAWNGSEFTVPGRPTTPPLSRN
jgi:peptidoglycan/xylan/chitin deacetylase (PgdA/CDA1 family)